MASKKLLGRSLTGGGASLSGVGGIVAERNRVFDDVARLEEQLAEAIFAYLERWQSARENLGGQDCR